MKSNKRIYYAPGLITLIILFFTFPTLLKKIVPKKEYCLDLFIPKDFNDKNDCHYMYSEYCLEKYITTKKKISFTLSENSKENSKKMEVIRFEALKLNYTEDTSTIILLTLSDSITYGEFVKILDMCKYDDHKRYASWENKFAIFSEIQRETKTENELNQFLVNELIYDDKHSVKINFLELQIIRLVQYYTWQGLILLIGWLILFLSFQFFRRKSSILDKH